MGFDNIVTAVILTIALLFAAYTFLSGTNLLAETTIESYRIAAEKTIEKITSSIKILTVSYSSGTLIAEIKNVGERKFLDFERFDAIVYGISDTGNNFVTYLNVDYYIEEEITNPGIFDPHEVAKLISQLELESGRYVLLICTPNAVCDSYEFYVR